MKFNKLGFRAKIVLPTIALTTLFIGALSAFVVFKVSTYAEKELHGKADEVAHRYANQVNLELDQAFVITRTLANAMAGMKINAQTDRRLVQNMLKQVLEENPQILAVWTGWEPDAFDGADAKFKGAEGHDSSGRFVPYWNRGGGKIAVEPLVDYDKPGPGDYYQLPKATMQESIIEPYMYPVMGVNVLITSVVVPIVIDGKFYGVSGIDFALDRFTTLVKNEKPFENSRLNIISNAGVFAATAEDAALNKSIDGFVDNPEALKAAVKGGATFASSFVDSKDQTSYYRTVAAMSPGRSKTPWAFEVIVPNDTGAAAITMPVILFALFSIAAVAIITTLITNNVTKPLYAFSDSIKGSVGQISESSTNLTGISQSAAEAINEQSAVIEQTSATLNEITTLVEKSLDHVEDSERAASQSHEAAQRGKEAMTRMVGAIGEIQETNASVMSQIENANSRVNEMVRVIENIRTKTGVINDIVFQTKLLSFNASVEAARAGDAGRGFAVVAEEVGNLARMSGQSAQEISDMLTKSADQVTSIVTHIQKLVQSSSAESRAKIEAGSQIARECSESLENIVSSVDHVHSLMSGIAQSANEQAKGISEVNKAVLQLEQATRETSGLSSKTAEYASTLSSEATGMNQLVVTIENEILGTSNTMAKLIELPQKSVKKQKAA